MYNRNWLAPISLTGKDPLTEVIVYSSLCSAHFFKLLCNSFFCFFNSHTGKFFGIYQLISFTQIILLFKCSTRNINMTVLIVSVYYLEHFDIVSNGIFKVSLVMARNSHNSTGTITCKNEIAYKHTYFFSVYRVDTCYTLQLTAGFCLIKLGTIHVVLFLCLINISLYFFPVLHSVKKAFGYRAIGSKHHKGDTIDRFNTSGKNREFSAAYNIKLDLNTGGLTYPVTLDSFCRFRPVYLFKTFKKLFSKSRLVNYPLFHIFTNNRKTATFGFSVNDLIV